MLKTNSKKASENIRAYILSHFTPENYTDNPPEGFENVALYILKIFRAEVWHTPEDYRYYETEHNAFEHWCSGLPSLLDCSYYYKPAIDDLGAILEETEAEKSRYTESQAEERLTGLIYNELKKVEERRA
jgi:hypothetical protein